ncbi:MAG: ferrous iron transporter B [Spirochaetales bacterium]|nr:ferrous iron transporter B [Spirochaetales bacterium]
MGSKAAAEAEENYGDSDRIIAAFVEAYGNDVIADAIDTESEDFDEEQSRLALRQLISATPADASVTYLVEDDETLAVEEFAETGKDQLIEAVDQYLDTSYKSSYGAPDPAEYGVWVPGIGVLAADTLQSLGAADWLTGLICDGIIAGVGAVLGFVPQMLVLFLLLAILEACGYMARIAFVLDRIFRKFGLSGKSFIPMLIGTGCGIPGIMASRTIENERDRRMTIMTTTFIPCGAKVPFISMIAGALFGGSALVATSAYFIGMAAIIISGIMLKKTRPFAGEPAPFVMELPAYHLPTVSNVLRSTWERGWSFIRKAGTIILLSTILVWFTSRFGVADGVFRMLEEDELGCSILAAIGGALAWVFSPLGWGTWQATVASFTGLIAKENIVGTMGILYSTGVGTVYANLNSVFTGLSGYSFMVFNLLCAPCFAAIGAIRREMNNPRWTWFAISYQCCFAYAVSLMIFQFGSLFNGEVRLAGLICALGLLALMVYMLFFKKYREPAGLQMKGRA